MSDWHKTWQVCGCVAAVGWLVGCGGGKPAPVVATPPAVKQPAAKPARLQGAVQGEDGAAATKPGVVVPAQGTVRQIDLASFFALHQAGQALVYDVRPAWFFGMGHVPGAVSFPGKAFEKRYPEELPHIKAAAVAGKTVVLYCTNLKCPDAGVVARWLTERGHSVSIYAGGWEEWRDAGMPRE